MGNRDAIPAQVFHKGLIENRLEATAKVGDAVMKMFRGICGGDWLCVIFADILHDLAGER